VAPLPDPLPPPRVDARAAQRRVLATGGLLAAQAPWRAFTASGRLLHLQVAVGLAAVALLVVFLLAYGAALAAPQLALLAAPLAAANTAAGVAVARHLGRVPPAPVDPHVQAALSARARREQARRIAAVDPALARDLRIGRPDLPHGYDDGGLVDLNAVPTSVLEAELGWSAQDAARVVRLREELGGFGHVAEAAALAGVPQRAVDRVVDRLVCVGDVVVPSGAWSPSPRSARTRRSAS